MAHVDAPIASDDRVPCGASAGCHTLGVGGRRTRKPSAHGAVDSDSAQQQGHRRRPRGPDVNSLCEGLAPTDAAYCRPTLCLTASQAAASRRKANPEIGWAIARPTELARGSDTVLAAQRAIALNAQTCRVVLTPSRAAKSDLTAVERNCS